MSFSLQVYGGDLIQTGSQLNVVYGTNKLRQDMTLWLSESYGIDPLHPEYGSLLSDYIGGTIRLSTQAIIYNEVMRVLENYQTMQFQLFKKNPKLFSMSELLWNIKNVNVGISYDTISLSIAVTNGQSGEIELQLNQGVT